MLQAYRAIIELLEKYWVMAVVYTSGRSVPPQVPWPQALEVMAGLLKRLRPHTTTYVTSYYYIYVLILLYMCSHTTCMCVLRLLDISYYTCVSSYYCGCPHSVCAQVMGGHLKRLSHIAAREISQAASNENGGATLG